MGRIIDLKMKDHLQFLISKILALGCSPKKVKIRTRRKIQSGIFLSQLLDQKEKTGKIDIQTLSGYRYSWEDGIYSSSLQEDWKTLMNEFRVKGDLNYLNLKFVPHRQNRCIQVAKHIHIAPSKDDAFHGRWAKLLANRAYLKAAGWTAQEAQEQITAVDNSASQYLEEAEIILRKLNLL